MSAMAKMVMRKFYREAEGYPERLPWHRHEPGPLLEKGDRRTHRYRSRA